MQFISKFLFYHRESAEERIPYLPDKSGGVCTDVEAKSEIYALAVSLGGTISAEHGVGIEKLAYLAISAGGTAVDYMKKVKEVFDPNKILNPGKIFKS